MTINRRSLFKIGALAGAALGAPQIMTRVALAAAPARSDVTNAGFHRFQMGEFEITTFLDGARLFDGPHPTFGSNQQAVDVEELMEENFLPTRQMLGQFNPVLVNTKTDLILFDTGNGAEGRNAGLGRLAQRLANSGYSPADVTIVALTHLHTDHINGLMEDGRPAFANARYVVGQTEWNFWTSTDHTGTSAANHIEAVRSKVLPLENKMTFIGDNGQVASGITGMLAAGHTPGHMAFMLESAGRNLLITGDTANHYVASLQKPDWEVVFDMDKTGAAETRKRIFGMLAADRLPFIGYHMPHPSIGYVEPLGTGFRFVPVTYQFAI